MAEKHERYEWRGEEVRDSGPCDPNYDADAAQERRERETGRIPAPGNVRQHPGNERQFPKDSKERK
jgi:hypothetical protein